MKETRCLIYISIFTKDFEAQLFANNLKFYTKYMNIIYFILPEYMKHRIQLLLHAPKYCGQLPLSVPKYWSPLVTVRIP